MTKPKHRRCEVCNVVTARYSHTNRQGPFVMSIWIRDPLANEVVTDNGATVRCGKHAEKVPAP